MEAGASRLAARWLAAHGADDVETALRSARARAARFPAPIGDTWPWAVNVVERLGPPLLLQRAGRASELDDAAFDALERRLQGHPNAWMRLLWMLVRTPLIEQVYPDPPPSSAAPHPLQEPELAEQIRARASLLNDAFDVIIVGSGAGGAPLAWALARAGQRVAVIEAGALVTPTTAPTVVERFFVEQGMLGSVQGGSTSLVVAGRAVGGTTVINSGTSLRPRPDALATWDALAGTRFADGALDPHLDAASQKMGVAPVPEDRLDASARLIREGLRRLGEENAFPLERNAPGCEGHGRCCFGCPAGAKLGTDRAWLPEAIASGATLLAQTRALGVVPSSSGVDVWVDGPQGRRRLRADRVVLAAGAIATPGLIRSQRLGDAWRLAGEALGIHPATKALGLMPEPLPHGGVPQGLGYRTPELPRVTFEGAHTPSPVTATVLTLGGQRHRWWMARHDRLANYGMMVRDRARGSVRHIAGRPYLRYRLHPDDARDLGAGLIRVAEALFAAGAERVLLPVAGTEPEIASRAQLEQLRPEHFRPENLATSGFHPQGTAGMGRVVDRDLTLLGAPRISVCDASVLPASPGVNPQLTIMALSLRLAAHLLE